MCGILITYNIKIDKSIKVLELLNHRGPYNSGYWNNNNVFVGMTQLPMKQIQHDTLPIYHNGKYISYNGELYDNEATCLQKEVSLLFDKIDNGIAVNGMFAVAAYDDVLKQITLARDEFGIKPIYYYANSKNKIFIACSEILPILELIGSVKPNKNVIKEILVFGTQVTEDTCFSDIKLLDPGLIIKISLPELILTEDNVHKLNNSSTSLEEALNTSILSCSDSFRDCGLLISDGLDSNLLLSFLDQNITKYNVATKHDECLNKKSYVNLNQCTSNPENFWMSMNRAVKSYSQPCRMSSILMYQILSDFITKDNCHLVISGEGADEIFWGYPRHKKIHNKFHSTINLSYFETLNIFFSNLQDQMNLLVDNEKIINDYHALAKADMDILHFINFLDNKFSLEPLLRRTDHLFMANSIEVRTPYLHFGIPRTAFQTGEQKIINSTSKSSLVKLMSERNKKYIHSEKKHFRAPLNNWERDLNLKTFFNNKNLEILHEFGICIDTFRNFINKNSSTDIFTFITLVVWYEQYKQFLQM